MVGVFSLAFIENGAYAIIALFGSWGIFVGAVLMQKKSKKKHCIWRSVSSLLNS